MSAFLSISNQMLFLFACILVGYILNKSRVVPENGDVVLSRLLSYAVIPAMVINSFRTNCTPANLRMDAVPLLICVSITVIAMGISYLLAPFFTSDKASQGVYRYALTLSNFGFVGNPLIQALLGEEALFHFLIFCLPGTIYAYTFGLIELTSGKQKFRLKMLATPTMISMAIGIVMGLLRVPLPVFADKAVGSLAACYAPLAMVMTGHAIARYDPLALIRNKQIYLLSLFRLVLIPLFFMGLCRLIRLDTFTTQMAVFYTAMPIGLNTIIFPAAYGGDETPGAAMAIISNVIGLVTVPLVVMLVL